MQLWGSCYAPADWFAVRLAGPMAPPRHAEMTPGLMTSFSTDILLNMTARQVVTAVRLYRRTHLDLMRSVSTACRRG